MTGIVYCLTNPEMPDLVKIGMTADLEGRLRTLDNTSVPVPFECVMAVEVDDPGTAERLLHEVFDERRVRRAASSSGSAPSTSSPRCGSLADAMSHRAPT